MRASRVLHGARGAACLFTVVALLVLAGCGGSTPEPETGEGPVTEEGQPESEPIDESVEEASVEPLPRSSVEVLSAVPVFSRRNCKRSRPLIWP